MVGLDISRGYGARFGISERERLLISEIGLDRIDSASCFVDYISEVYGIAKSTAWYSLKRLKSSGILYFLGKEEEGEQGLFLTEKGKEALGCVRSSIVMLNRKSASLRGE